MAEKKEYVKLWLSYESYFEAFSDVEVGRLVRAMMKYRASREEPKFNGNERFIWPAIRRDIDEAVAAQESAADTYRENGKKGGRPRKPNWNPENPKNQIGFSETQKTYGQRTKDKGQGHGQGQGQGGPPLPPVDAAVEVVSDYLDRVNPSASPASLEELRAYAEEMGAAVCKRAFDIALDSKKTTWPYIRAILRDKRSKGVKCLADWDALEARKTASRAPTPEKDRQKSLKADMDWMDQFLEKTGGGA